MQLLLTMNMQLLNTPPRHPVMDEVEAATVAPTTVTIFLRHPSHSGVLLVEQQWPYTPHQWLLCSTLSSSSAPPPPSLNLGTHLGQFYTNPPAPCGQG